MTTRTKPAPVQLLFSAYERFGGRPEDELRAKNAYQHALGLERLRADDPTLEWADLDERAQRRVAARVFDAAPPTGGRHRTPEAS